MTIATVTIGKAWTVPSQTQTDTVYQVRKVNGSLTCDCNGFFYRAKCKHVAAVAAKLNAERPASKLSPEARAWGIAQLTGKRA